MVIERLRSSIMRSVSYVSNIWNRLHFFSKVGVGLLTFVILFVGIWLLHSSAQYTLTISEKQLVGKVYAGKDKIREDANSYAFNAATKATAAAGTPSVDTLVAAANKSDSTAKEPYRATLSKDLSKGIVFGQGEGDLSFSLTPLQDTGRGKITPEGNVIYPDGDARHVYTFKRNGLKEDIILSRAPADSITYSWKINLGSKLEARVMPDGSVGVYGPDQKLFGDVQINDDKSRQLIENARKKGAKTDLVFVLPAPFFVDGNGKRDTQGVNYTLKGDTLTLHASGLKKRTYPLSIDPTITVTTTNDFKFGNFDGSISYANSDQITRAAPTGTLSGWKTASTSITGRGNDRAVAYNGYLYNIGGNALATIEYAAINSDGSLGAWATTTNNFINGRDDFVTGAYNGYMYIWSGWTSGTLYNTVQYALICTGSNNGVGGCNATPGNIGTWTNSANTFAGGARRNAGGVIYNGYIYITGGDRWLSGGNTDTQYALICTGSNNGINGCGSTVGDVGTWMTASAVLPQTRTQLKTVAYNGYMYAIGGWVNNNTNSTTVMYAAINADGSLGGWKYTSSMVEAHTDGSVGFYNGKIFASGGLAGTSTTVRSIEAARVNDDGSLAEWAKVGDMISANWTHASAIYAGYMYIIGGSATPTSKVTYAQLFANDGAGSYTMNMASSFTTARDTAAAVANNGYLYILGGGPSPYFNDVQVAKIRQDGSLGPWAATRSFTTARQSLAAAVYGKYMYVIGGYNGTYQSDVQYAYINTDGTLGAWNTTTALAVARGNHAVTVANGFLYVLGGIHATSDTLCNTATTTYCNDALYAQINADGTIGSWSSTSKFTTGRQGHSTGIYNGYMYVVGGVNSSNVYQSDVQIAQINGNGSLGAWSATTSFTNARGYAAVQIVNGYMYIIGGNNLTTSFSDMQYAPLNLNGTITGGTWVAVNNTSVVNTRVSSANSGGIIYILGGQNSTVASTLVQYLPTAVGGGFKDHMIGTWENATPLGVGRSDSATFAYNGYLYVAGGSHATNDTACNGVSSLYCSDVWYARINANGTLGYWNATTSMPSERSQFGWVAYGGYIYVAGGANGSKLSDVQYAPFNADGTIGTWSATTSLGSTRSGNTLVAYNGYVYSLGGDTGSYLSDVDYALICTGLNNGTAGCGATPGTLGTWSNANTGGSFTTARSLHASFAYNGYIYVMGGYNGSYLSDVQYAPINSNGTIGSWSSTTGFSTARAGYFAALYNGTIVLAGGNNGSPLQDVQYAAVNSNGTITSWTTTYSQMLSARASLTGAIYNGRIYLTGGDNSKNVDVAAFNVPAQTAYYEKTFDAGVGTGINSFIVNGQSNCGMSVQYKSAGTDGIFGNNTRIQQYTAGNTITVSGSSKYLIVVVSFDDQLCGGVSSVTDIAVTYTYAAPSAPQIGMPISEPTPTLRDYATSFSTSNAPTITIPATTQGGDKMYIVTSGANAPSASIPVGWTVVDRGTGSNWQWAVYSKNAAGAAGSVSSEANSVVTMSYSGFFDVQSAIYVVAGGDATPDLTYTYSTSSANPTTITDIAEPNDLFLYYGSVRTASSSTTTLSRGTTDATRSADTNTGEVIGHENPTAGSVSQTFTPSVAGVGSFFVIIRLPRMPVSTYPIAASSTTPTFNVVGYQQNVTYLRYKIDVCSSSDCSSIVRTVDQTASQTGWSGQDQQGSTAYGGAVTVNASTIASYAYQAPALSSNTQYWWRAYVIDPALSNTWSPASDIVAFRTNGAPAAPTLIAPSDTSVNTSTTPQMTILANDPDSDFVQYKIEICSVSDCSVVLQTIDQTASQAGWQAQSQLATTAYLSGDAAIYNVSSALNTATQYWWRAYAIDPIGTNSWGSASTISTFTTSANPVKVQIGGSTIIGRGTRLGN